MPRLTKRQRFLDALAAHAWSSVGRAEWDCLRLELPDVSESSLRDWLHESGLPVEQPYRGVRMKSLDELEDSLLAMTSLYVVDPASQKRCRALVIEGKDRARFASRNLKVDSAKRHAKAEMVQWMLVWLDDPAMFPIWAQLRRGALPPAAVSDNLNT